MKKVLYSTTALAAAGMFAFSGADALAAEKVKLGVGGSFIWLAGVADSDADSQKDQSGNNMVADSEINFRGNTTLDNGVRVDVIIDLESDQARANAGTTLDESYIKVGNLKEWGEFRLGSTKQAHFIFKVNAPAVNTINNALNSDTQARFIPTTTGTHFFNHDGGRDDMKAMYITPNLGGFQAGVSYTPSTANSDAPPKTDGMMPSETDNISIGANFKSKFGDAGVAVSGGWTRHTGSTEATTVQAGASVSFAGLSIGGGWAERTDDMDKAKQSMTNSLDIEGWMAGVGYKTGPWSLALTWLYTEDDQSMLKGKDESNQYTLGAAYSLGAGVTVGASLFMIDFQDEERTMTAGASTPNNPSDDKYSMPMNNEGWGVLAGIKVAF